MRRKPNWTVRTLASVLGFFASASGAWAQLGAQNNGPIDISGDTLEIVDDVATWTGRVSAIQGDAILTADKLVADLDELGDIKVIRAFGDIRYSAGAEAISGDRAVYDAVARTITVIDNVIVTQGEQVMTGGTLVYWIDTGRIRFAPPEGKRIRGIFRTNSEASGQS